MKVRAYKYSGPAFLVIIVFSTLVIYANGRYGGFLLDDRAHIPHVNLAGHGIDGLIRFVFSGDFGTQGRWLSRLSFLIDSSRLPADPARFKQTNILIHLLNGLLVIWFVLRLMRLLGRPEHTCQFVALAVGALWLLHPLNVSTTLYIVQRMTELSAFFVLLGMLCYLKGREVLVERPARGYVWMSIGVAGGTVLAFFSKENGALLPLFVLITEAILLRRMRSPSGYKIWKQLFLYLPALGLGAYLLIHQLPRSMHMEAFRPFTLGERLMSEARAIVEYLHFILIPTRTGTGVFHDDFVISHGLLDPPTTLLSIGVIAGLLSVTVIYRNRLPVLSFGIAWFFVGHVLESTILPLELYFEHRNYLPMLGPLFALCFYALTTTTRLRIFLRSSVVVVIGLAAVGTWHNVRVFSDLSLNLYTWETEHPNSPRVLQYVASKLRQLEAYDKSEKRIRKLVAIVPNAAYPKLQLILLSCLSGEDKTDHGVHHIIATLDDTEREIISSQVIRILLLELEQAPCEFLTLDHVRQMLNLLIENPNYRRARHELANFYELRARTHRAMGDPRRAALDFNKSYSSRKNHYVAGAEAKAWTQIGEYERALEAVRKAKENYYIVLQGFKFHYESAELDQWETFLTQQIQVEPDQ